MCRHMYMVCKHLCMCRYMHIVCRQTAQMTRGLIPEAHVQAHVHAHAVHVVHGWTLHSKRQPQAHRQMRRRRQQQQQAQRGEQTHRHGRAGIYSTRQRRQRAAVSGMDTHCPLPHMRVRPCGHPRTTGAGPTLSRTHDAESPPKPFLQPWLVLVLMRCEPTCALISHRKRSATR